MSTIGAAPPGVLYMIIGEDRFNAVCDQTGLTASDRKLVQGYFRFLEAMPRCRTPHHRVPSAEVIGKRTVAFLKRHKLLTHPRRYTFVKTISIFNEIVQGEAQRRRST